MRSSLEMRLAVEMQTFDHELNAKTFAAILEEKGYFTSRFTRINLLGYRVYDVHYWR